MGEEKTAQKVDPGLVARIVQSYVRKNSVAVDQLASLISTVHSALRGAGTAPSPIAEVLTPAVPIRRSVRRCGVVPAARAAGGSRSKKNLSQIWLGFSFCPVAGLGTP
jgi:predicted transcriptional regulator